MKKFFYKNEILCSIILIVMYVLINMICINSFGITDYRSVIINTIFSLVLVLLMIYLNRISFYGLTKGENIKNCLYFIPLILIISVNLWSGININNSKIEILCHILTMINIGFIEEIIFRGFLFKAMLKDGTKPAIIVSSVTFGIGHIINLLNGAEVVPTLFQIISAISIGYLFVTIFNYSKTLIPCIITHSLINALSIFNVDNSTLFYISSIFLIIYPLIYVLYIKYHRINKKN